MKQLLVLALLLPAFACTDKQEVEASEAETNVTVLADMAVESGTHNVKCGCSVDGVGKCGNYIEVESQYVKIANGDDLGLGAMEWCTTGPATATAAGAIKDGEFVGTTLVIE